jgi:phosphoribosyl-AMP cyclohydrolase / phosphoribosyl-ATP pyrophosphohydrolase
MLSARDMERIAWDKAGGLIPAVVQCAQSHVVLMLGYMNAAALAQTLASRHVTFYSRSKQRLWTKGESSGHVLTLVDIWLDCDGDTLLVRANPHGPTCHTGSNTCFGDFPAVPAEAPQVPFIDELDALIAARKRDLPAGSYTTKLFSGELRRIAQKVGEEGVETALAAIAQDDAALLGESADLLYHMLVLLHARGLTWAQLAQTLAKRHQREASSS